MAVTTSPVEGRSSAIRLSRRLRDSASAGNSSSASKAAVSRLPWPSLCGGRRPCGARPAGVARGAARSREGAHGPFIGRGADLEAGDCRPPFSPIGSLDGRLSLLRVRCLSGPRRLSSAPSIRASARSRPSRATVSKIPGDTVVPVSATRRGWKTCVALPPGALDDPAQRRLDALGRPRLGHVGQRRARGGEMVARPRRREEPLPRGGVVDRPVEEGARQRQELDSVEIFSCVIARRRAGRCGP